MPMVQPTMVALDRIQLPAMQPRQHIGDVSDLLGSMERSGITSSVLLEQQADGSYLLIQGARRLAAAKERGEQQLPALVYPAGRLTAAEVWLSQINENERRRNLSNMEKALAYQQQKLLCDYELLCKQLKLPPPHRTDISEADYAQLVAEAEAVGVKVQQVSWPAFQKLVGLSETQRKKLLRLTRLPAALQQAMLTSSLALDALIAVADAPDGQQAGLLAAAEAETHHAKVVQAVARYLHEPTANLPVSDLLAATERERAAAPKLTPEQLAERLRQPVTRPASVKGKPKATRAVGLADLPTQADDEQQVSALTDDLRTLLRTIQARLKLLRAGDEQVQARQLLQETIRWLQQQETKLKGLADRGRFATPGTR